MSHILKLEAKLTDVKAVEAACRRLGLKEPYHGTANIYSGKQTGLVVQLPGWNYPIVINGEGAVTYDNFNGHWGKIEHLHALQQAYALEGAKQMAEAQGWAYSETQLEDGAVEAQLVQYA
jgi:hypothetical protein